MKIYKTSKTSIMFHNTPTRFLGKILKNGLTINNKYEKSQASGHYIPDIYGVNPIFLSLEPNLFKESGDATLKVNTDGLPLVADVPSLTHFGAYYSDFGDGIWFETGTTPKRLKIFEDEDGMFSYEDLIDPSSELALECIKLTKTAACIKNIDPKRIKLISG